MISGLSQFLGLNANAAPKMYPRQIDLSGNIFSFSMPENFSKDMPAENMVETLDIGDLKKFDNPEYGNLIRRWWDIKEPGFFKKELGSVMMDISIQKIPMNNKKLLHSKPYNIFDRIDFLLALDEKLDKRYANIKSELGANSSNPYDYIVDFASIYGQQLESSFRDHIFNSQKWIGYTVTAPLDQLIVGLALPVAAETYLEVVFTYSPNQNVMPREFLDVAYRTTRPIENSFSVTYQSGNEIKKLVEEKWISQTNDDVMAEHYNEILIPLFGPDIHHRIEEGKKNALKLQKELGRPLE